MGKKLCLMGIVLHFYCISNAQSGHLISFGIDANIGTSAQLFTINSLHYSFGAAKEISFYTYVKGTDEQALDFLGKIGFSMNPIKYRIVPSSSFTIDQLNLSLNGFILFPTKYPSFFVLGGISGAKTAYSHHYLYDCK